MAVLVLTSLLTGESEFVLPVVLFAVVIGPLARAVISLAFGP